ncbi:hypothetical protein M0R04_06580 [Candidatus Dojkabacteria bacterium]|jgi:hypothetical protein|nr:hypothetical protein [Candidatus Dojkabacteria bacterium]
MKFLKKFSVTITTKTFEFYADTKEEALESFWKMLDNNNATAETFLADNLKIKKCICCDDRGKGRFIHGHFENCPCLNH